MPHSSPIVRLVIGSAFVLSSCSSGSRTPEASSEEVRADLQALVRSMADAMNRSDASALMELYRRDPSTSSASDGDLSRGWEAIRTSTDSMIGTEGLFRVSVGTVDVTPLGARHALAVAPATVTVQTPDGDVQVRAVLSVVAERDSAGWRIIHEHSSFQTPANQ